MQQCGPKYRDSGIDTRITLIRDSDSDSDSGTNSWIDSTYKQPLNKPAIYSPPHAAGENTRKGGPLFFNFPICQAHIKVQILIQF